MNRDKREPDYPAELESQFILKLPNEPAKALRDIVGSGENLKNRLMIQIDDDMRNGQVRLDNWLMHAKIVDLPTVIESLKTIDNKSFYKTADICQMMICKNDPEQVATEEESPSKNKKKDPNKVDKKFLYPHGITPPTKNARKRRFRKTLKKKCAEAPEIEKEVKRLLRADNEAVSVTWEVVEEEDEHATTTEKPTLPVNPKPEKKTKSDKTKSDKTKSDKTKSEKTKREPVPGTSKGNQSSNLVDIFGGAVSDSEEEDNTYIKNVGLQNPSFPAYDSQLDDISTLNELSALHLTSKIDGPSDSLPIEFASDMFDSPLPLTSATESQAETPGPSGLYKTGARSSEEDTDYVPDPPKENMTERIEQLKAEVEELKQRRVRTRHEIAGIENMALRQRFEDIIHTLNQDIMYKEMEYQGLLTLQNSDVI